MPLLTTWGVWYREAEKQNRTSITRSFYQCGSPGSVSMGCSSSTEFVANDKLGQDEYAVMFFEMISLSSTTINALYTLFLEIDVREVGHISYDDIIFKYRCETLKYEVHVYVILFFPVCE